MDHAQANDSQAVEKYLLGQLSPAEREEFEEHYFACHRCAEELRLAAMFEDNARALFEDDPGLFVSGRTNPLPPPKTGWFPGFLAAWTRPLFAAPAFAAVFLCGVVGYQNLVTIPALRTQSSPVFDQDLVVLPVRAASRGVSNGDSERSYKVPMGAKSFLLQFYPGWENPAPRLQCAIQDASGRTVFSAAVHSAENGLPVAVRVPTSSVTPGRWVLVVYDRLGSKTGPERSRYPFMYQID